jgi:hypothetical protein
MIAFSIFALLLRLLGTLGGVSRRATPTEPTPPDRMRSAEAMRSAEPARTHRQGEGPDDGPDDGLVDEPEEHPESLTAVLDPAAEEYLAWLADHHWPADEYLELERGWEVDRGRQAGWGWQIDRGRQADRGDWPAGLGPYEPAPIRSTCPQCLRHSDDVWPCWTCGRMLHSACGHGLRRRPVRRPYRTRDMSAEAAVTAEWICTDCSCVVGLDVERGDDRRGGDADS